MRVMRTAIVWTTGQTLALKPDIELTVSALPPKRKSPLAARVILAVKSDGTIANCFGRRITGMPEKQQATPQLFDLACAEARRGLKPMIVRDSTGTPQPSYQELMVHFVASRKR